MQNIHFLRRVDLVTTPERSDNLAELLAIVLPNIVIAECIDSDASEAEVRNKPSQLEFSYEDDTE